MKLLVSGRIKLNSFDYIEPGEYQGDRITEELMKEYKAGSSAVSLLSGKPPAPTTNESGVLEGSPDAGIASPEGKTEPPVALKTDEAKTDEAKTKSAAKTK